MNHFPNGTDTVRPHEFEITVRQDAPHELRGVVIHIAYHYNLRGHLLYSLICRVLGKRPDRTLAEYEEFDEEIHKLIDNCEWHRVYDVIEAIAKHIRKNSSPYDNDMEEFENEINDYFLDNGIGWRLIEERIEMRGSESFEETIRSAELELEKNDFNTARNELREALGDISRRPEPDITGAIQHSLVALECVSREACGDRKPTLGDIMKKYKGLLPKPLDEAVTKLWGFTSEQGRHLEEGRVPAFEEAELVVRVSSAIATYLARKKTLAQPA